MTLDELRGNIDAIDRQVVALLNQRLGLAKEVGHLKRKHGGEFYVPSREAEVFAKVLAHNKTEGGSVPERALQVIWREIISASITLEMPLRIAYLGPEATFTEQAALKAFGSSLTYQPMATIRDVFGAVTHRDAHYGVVPIENSTGGAVFHSLDMLAETELKIIAQVYLDIEHCLIGQGSLESITEVHSKDQALIQCREWLRRNLPAARHVEVESTAAAVQSAGQKQGLAAVASALAADRYGVPILARGIQDASDNVTRFLVIGRESCAPLGDGRDRTSLMIAIKDEVGALGRVLSALSERGINLLKIESRPSRKKAWDYVFFVDLAGHWFSQPIQSATADIQASGHAVKWLGSYPV